MQRLFLSLVVVFVGCLAIPANLGAQTAAAYNSQGLQWRALVSMPPSSGRQKPSRWLPMLRPGRKSFDHDPMAFNLLADNDEIGVFKVHFRKLDRESPPIEGNVQGGQPVGGEFGNGSLQMQ